MKPKHPQDGYVRCEALLPIKGCQIQPIAAMPTRRFLAILTEDGSLAFSQGGRSMIEKPTEGAFAFSNALGEAYFVDDKILFTLTLIAFLYYQELTRRAARREISFLLEYVRALDPKRAADEYIKSKSWSRKSAQDDKWSFCLTAGTLCPTNQEKQ
jgi:hypothetical protein